MPINSKTKGKVGELELAALFKAHGYEARRSQQYKGSDHSSDITHSLPGVHVECKRVEKLNIREALEQAKRDCGPNNRPVVFHRPNRCDWMVTLSAEDFFVLAELYLKFS